MFGAIEEHGLVWLGDAALLLVVLGLWSVVRDRFFAPRIKRRR